MTTKASESESAYHGRFPVVVDDGYVAERGDKTQEAHNGAEQYLDVMLAEKCARGQQ